MRVSALAYRQANSKEAGGMLAAGLIATAKSGLVGPRSSSTHLGEAELVQCVLQLLERVLQCIVLWSGGETGSQGRTQGGD